jgi:hypothetical protein
MERELTTGHVENELEVFSRERPNEFGIRTTSGPTPFVYRYRFTSSGADTVVHLDAGVEPPGAAAVLGPLAARAVRRGVDPRARGGVSLGLLLIWVVGTGVGLGRSSE